MKRTRRIAQLTICLLLLLLLTVSLAWAKPTTSEQARQVVANWIFLNRHPLGAPMRQKVKDIETFADASGPLYFVVYLEPVGLVFVPADDLVEPIIGFAPEMKHYDPSLDNPLGALVSQDMPGRVLQARYLERATQALGGEFVPSGRQQRSQTKWAALEQGEVPGTLSLGGLTSGLPDAQIDDMRVSPLLGQIRWAQDTVNGQACYNYYTPPGPAATPANFPSGCVATAMAQIMRKHQHPPAPNAGTFNISVNGVTQAASIRGGNGAAGNYGWANMAADPLASGVNETQRQAIGALTYDAGVSVRMSYSPMANGGSAADTLDAAAAFRNTFKYTNAKNAFNDWNNFRFADLYDIVNPNLDAGYPVLFGIRRPVAGGSHGYHAIAADGYGYHLLTLYHHLNMGWADAQNIWYELPNIDATARLYDTVTKIVYNVFVTGTGEIVSGRVLNSCGGAVSGVSVTATGGGQTFNATTNTYGIYALAKLPSNNSYTITVNQAGYQSQVVYVGPSQDRTTNTGNVWAVDFKVNRGPVNAEYVLYNLGVLDQKVSVAYAINNLSQVAGGMRVNNSYGNYHPCLWAETEKGKFGFYRFGTEVVDYGELHGISDNGLAVGWAYKAVPGVTVDKNPIYVQQVGTSLNLGNLPIPTTGLGGMVPEGRAYGVNNNGQIVGHAILGQNDLAPCSWASTSSMPQRVGTLGYGGGTDQTRATRINQAGWIVGKHNNQAFLWNGASVTTLGPTGSNSEARGLTNLTPPTIVGLMGIFDYLSQIGSNAVIFNGAAIQALDATRGKASHGVNSQGQIVGTSSEGAFVYDQAKGMRNLNLLVNEGDWNLKEAFSINDNGEIVGWGWYKCVLPFAYMLRPLYTITATAGTGGTISPDGAVKVTRGYDQTFNFAPDPCYQIANVLVDGVSQGAITSYTFSNVTANHTISVAFVAGTTNYKIIATAGSGGTIAPAGTILVASGSSKTFIITPNSGYRVADVIVDEVSKGPISSYTFGDVRGNHIIEASFTPGGTTYTITATAGTGGTISPSGTVTVNSGGSQTFTIAANSGYQIADVKVDNVSQGAITSYTFSNVTANHTITASYTPVSVTYNITATAGTGGTISPSGTVTVNSGGSQTFAITPTAGYRVAGVTVDGVSQGAITSYTFSNVTANHTISASFALLTYTITASAGSGGTFSPSGTVTVNSGGSQTFTIIPTAGYRVAAVTVDGVSQGAITSYTFSNVTANHTISASFALLTYTITATAGTGGTISPSGNVTVNSGGSQTFTIAANSGYQIADVKVDNVSKGAITTYTFSSVNANHTISASFALLTYTITASAGTGGTISPSGTVTVNSGANQGFSITANSGYRVAAVTVDGVSQGAITTYTFSNVTANHTISASFALLTYTITASAGSGGTISPSGTVTVNSGANQGFSITANSGYRVAAVTVDGVSQGAITSYTFSSVTANHTISASFALLPYTITASAGTGGTISPSGTVTVNSGGSQTFTITPTAGYRVAAVTVDGVSQGAITSYSFSNVTANHTITASFALLTYTITASAGSGGTISPSGTVTVNSGASQSFTITANTAYKVTDVKVDNVSQGAISSYTFTNVQANHTIAASFSAVTGTFTISASAGSGGSVSPSGAVIVNAGANQIFTMTCNSGYVVNDVLVDGSSVGPVNSYTFTNVSANHTISASFKKPGSCGAFFDHFDGGQLGSTWIVRNPDPAHYSISDSFLHTITLWGALFTTNPFYSNLFLIPNPVGNCDFQMTLKVSGYLPSNGNGQEICLIAYIDDHNFVKCSNTRSSSNQRRWSLQGTDWGTYFDYSDADHTEFYMRLTKVGKIYRLYSSVDGITYNQRIEGMTFTGDTPPYLGFIAMEDPWIQASPVSADIDYFAVDSLNTPNKKGTMAGPLELLLLSD